MKPGGDSRRADRLRPVQPDSHRLRCGSRICGHPLPRPEPPRRLPVSQLRPGVIPVEILVPVYYGIVYVTQPGSTLSGYGTKPLAVGLEAH